MAESHITYYRWALTGNRFKPTKPTPVEGTRKWGREPRERRG
jgi:hypothetical protein